MIERIKQFIQLQPGSNFDARMDVFTLEAQTAPNQGFNITGRVLEERSLREFELAFSQAFPGIPLECSGVNILRKPSNLVLSVTTNLASAHTSPSFLAEMSSQLIYGEKVEILEEHERWVLGRHQDGYLSFIYRTYLGTESAEPATHIVIDPVVEILAACDRESPRLTRLFCGTHISANETSQGWLRINAPAAGFILASGLRSLASLPSTPSQIRARIVADASTMIGIPYLWGGATSAGIDCSGFARLLHRLSGLDIPRDADMQSAACRPVQEAFQPGDLLFFSAGGGSRKITHVAVSLGGWDIIHASRARNGVYYENVQQVSHLRETFTHAGSFIKA